MGTSRIFMNARSRCSAFNARNQYTRSIVQTREQSGRAGGIRTHGLHVPNVALYQAEPQPVVNGRTEVISPSERKQLLIFTSARLENSLRGRSRHPEHILRKYSSA
jgi:hypothetical protein